MPKAEVQMPRATNAGNAASGEAPLPQLVSGQPQALLARRLVVNPGATCSNQASTTQVKLETR